MTNHYARDFVQRLLNNFCQKNSSIFKGVYELYDGLAQCTQNVIYENCTKYSVDCTFISLL